MNLSMNYRIIFKNPVKLSKPMSAKGNLNNIHIILAN